MMLGVSVVFSDEQLPPTEVVLDETSFFVERVIDGDTVVLRDLTNTTQRVRLVGIDTPETVHPTKPVACFGKEASTALREKIEKQVVTLETDVSQGETDRYGRTLGYVFLEDGTFVNEWLIMNGYAYEYTYDKANPYQYQSAFINAQQRAQEAQVGLWEPGVCE